MAARGFEPPLPLPSNADAWTAFIRVYHYRHAPMGTPYLPNWSDIKPVLELYGLWSLEVHSRLSVCFMELLTMEAETRKANDG
jgi:hypothetical protein